MNLRELAEKDLAKTLENNETGSACELVIVDTNGNEKILNGSIGDIGYLLDTEGNPISGRSIVANFRMSTFLSGDNYVVPGEGWQVRYRDMKNQEWTLYVVRAEPDRTIGICRLILSLHFEDTRGI